MTELGKPVLTALMLLEQAGYPSYVVGGCLRDLLLGKSAQDYDLATPAAPWQTLSVFHGYTCFRQGEKFGTVGVLIDGEKLEITTFRSDIGYADNRHPDQVVFSDSIYEDLSRRDFTVNSIACGLDGQMIDPFGGEIDLKDKLLRATGDPAIRFNEDALRILRLFRFAAQLGFNIEQYTFESAVHYRKKLTAIPKERITAEFLRLLSYDCEKTLQLMSDRGVLEVIGIGKIENATPIQTAPNDPILRLAELIYLSESDSKIVCSAFKLSNIQKQLLNTFLSEFSSAPYQSKSAFKQRYGALLPEQWKKLIQAKMILGQDVGDISAYIDQIEQNNEPYLLSQLALNGDDLSQMGYEGREIGKALKKCLAYVLEHPESNTKSKLTEFIK
ncbi:MAG TPA: hypothetical protein PK629_10400 [Oscillospiraceae bacterium]|nr:hypothetical protein [Oscillospiraceae bacterium]HPF56330.1 hypothetical protein [Clostridiales bacterium]HPK36454.1 hypothetical protein [Oscillospiraceae bacterium]HPR76417.1 hypothetical protein [Oscillospiraceae bacterium]